MQMSPITNSLPPIPNPLPKPPSKEPIPLPSRCPIFQPPQNTPHSIQKLSPRNPLPSLPRSAHKRRLPHNVHRTPNKPTLHRLFNPNRRPNKPHPRLHLHTPIRKPNPSKRPTDPNDLRRRLRSKLGSARCGCIWEPHRGLFHPAGCIQRHPQRT